MKLYATVIGRKNGAYVEKGQGSNQSLAIEIMAEGLEGIPTRTNMYRLSLNVGNDNEFQAELLNYSTGEAIELTKGERQKGDKCLMPGCNRPGTQENGYCHSCDKTL